MAHEITVNGKQVVLRTAYPVREFAELRRKFAKLMDLEWAEECALLGKFVESWEFDGDPREPKAWGEMDAFSEMMPIENAIGELLAEKMQSAKNSAAGSTTPSA